MAKEKIRKLVKQTTLQAQQIQALQTKLNEVVTMLGVVVHKNGGEFDITELELKELPNADFVVNRKDKTFTLKLDYKTEEKPTV